MHTPNLIIVTLSSIMCTQSAMLVSLFLSHSLLQLKLDCTSQLRTIIIIIPQLGKRESSLNKKKS